MRYWAMGLLYNQACNVFFRKYLEIVCIGVQIGKENIIVVYMCSHF